MPRGPGLTQRKILLFLYGGLALGLSRSPAQSFRIIRLIGREWRSLKRESLWRSIRGLYASQLVTARENPNGTCTIVLTKKGRECALTYKVDEMKIEKPAVWDRKWRIITFDIPERMKKTRDALRLHLQRIGCIEFQKSVFIHPYPCDNEIDFLIELHHARPYVRKIIATTIDNEMHLRVKFGLNK